MKNKMLLTLPVLCISVLLGFNTLNAQTAQQYFDMGNAFFKNGQFDQAIDNYTKSIRLAPKVSTTYFARGHAYNLGKNLFDLAIKDYNIGLNFDPTNLTAIGERGNCYYVLRNYDMALAD